MSDKSKYNECCSRQRNRYANDGKKRVTEKILNKIIDMGKVISLLINQNTLTLKIGVHKLNEVETHINSLMMYVISN